MRVKENLEANNIIYEDLLRVLNDKMISARKFQTWLKYKQTISKEDAINLNIILR